ncbi:universal stress protein [Pseudolysinimonas sp.]|uniref:universal stress protein n=1 Tax=Pseudolysinimonas sp. TaxID=2680009 RepID=UPI003F811BD6
MDENAVEEIGVAFDGGIASRAALEWSVQHALITGAAVVAIGADGDADPDAAWAEGEAPDAIVGRLADAVEWVHVNAPSVPIRPLAEHGDAAEVLVDHSRHLGLLVMGRRAHPGHRSLFEPESRKLAATAECPVVLVPVDHPEPDGPVVVGVGMEERSTAALDFAADVAADANRVLHIVHAWWSYEVPDDARGEPLDATDYHQGIADRAAEAARARHPGLEVTVDSIIGDAYVALRAQERHASLLVLGRRRSGLLVQWLLGTLALDLLSDLVCPVAVVPVARRP